MSPHDLDGNISNAAEGTLAHESLALNLRSHLRLPIVVTELAD
jgi:hypothetical protein